MKVLTLLVSTGLLLTASEVAFRIFGDPSGGNAETLALRSKAREDSGYIKSDDPVLIYETRPNYLSDGKRVSEASGILRATDVPVQKPPGVFRIVVLGDSISAGHEERANGRLPYPERLEVLLKSAYGEGVEVLNFGTDGYTTLQEARLFETKASRFSPDLIVLQYCFNDTGGSYTPTVWFLDNIAPRSFLLDFVRRKTGNGYSEMHPLHPRYSLDAMASYTGRAPGFAENIVAGLERFASSARGVPGLFVLFPVVSDDGMDVHLQRVYALIRSVATQHGFHVVDLSEAFAKQQLAQIRAHPTETLHPGPLGHQIAAQQVFDTIRESGLVERARAGQVGGAHAGPAPRP